MVKKQLDLFLNKGHGGKRTGAGRKRIDKTKQLHYKRADFDAKYPVHVNIKLVKNLPNLRTKISFKIIKNAIRKSRLKGLRIVHFSVQRNHLHLLVETSGKVGLSKGMQSLCTSIAKSINARLNRSGRVFIDRYHPHILKTLREVKNTLIYIFQNYAKHTKTPNRFDSFSSFICFSEKEKLGLRKVDTYSIFPSVLARDKLIAQIGELIEDPLSWHLRVGWKKI